jgi:hypothetical protein
LTSAFLRAALVGALGSVGRQVVRDGSRAEHQDAEASSLMSALLDGRVNETGYTEYLAMLRPTYAAVARIEASVADSTLFFVHHYTRYLGDLSGGQAIGRILARTFGPENGDGTSFYRFDVVPKPYEDAYRARLDFTGRRCRRCRCCTRAVPLPSPALRRIGSCAPPSTGSEPHASRRRVGTSRSASAHGFRSSRVSSATVAPSTRAPGFSSGRAHRKTVSSSVTSRWAPSCWRTSAVTA